MKILIIVPLMLLSFMTFGAKIIVTGEPIVLEQRDNVYYPPQTFVPSTSYTYVSIGGKTKVCYLNPQTALTEMGMVTINVEVQGNVTTWNCYDYNTTYFEARP